MKKLTNVEVFCENNLILAMLHGYFFANNINLNSFNFNGHSSYEVTKQKPDLILVQLNLISDNRELEANLLSQVATNDQIKICCLNINLTRIIYSELPAWIDEIITNPFDINQIADYIINNFSLNNHSSDERRCMERRSFTDRRWMEIRSFSDTTGIESNCNGYDSNKVSKNQGEAGDAKFILFKIDQQQKCLFLNGNKVYLTPKEFELIDLLLSNIDRVFKNDEIINRLWPNSNRATKSDLYQYMHLLRRKIETDPNKPQFILTVRGFGYKLNSIYYNYI